MCFSERKIPACIVGGLSVITLILAVVMILLSVRFNNSGLSTDLGDLGDYANFTFIALMAASILALGAAICGILTCKFSNRCIAVTFGCTLLPAALIILVYGIILGGISHTSEEDLRQFCTEDYSQFENTDPENQIMQTLKETIEEVDYRIGGLVSQTMCSQLCPCDLDDVPVDVQAEWIAILNDENKLEEFGRCIPGSVDCDEDDEVIYALVGVADINEIIA